MNSMGEGTLATTPLSKSKAREMAFMATTICEPG